MRRLFGELNIFCALPRVGPKSIRSRQDKAQFAAEKALFTRCRDRNNPFCLSPFELCHSTLMLNQCQFKCSVAAWSWVISHQEASNSIPRWKFDIFERWLNHVRQRPLIDVCWYNSEFIDLVSEISWLKCTLWGANCTWLLKITFLVQP